MTLVWSDSAPTISISYCKKDVTPLLTHRSYIFLTLTILPPEKGDKHSLLMSQCCVRCTHTFCLIMMTSSNGLIFRVTGHLCEKSPVPGEFPTQRPVTRSSDVFFDLRLNKWLNKQQSWGWWFDTLSFPLWHWGRDKMAANFLTTISNAFSWMKIYKPWLTLHWSLFLRFQLIIFQHCFKKMAWR